jgi:hypothetical protein
MTPSISLKIDRCLRGTCRLFLQNQRKSQERNKHEAEFNTCFILVSCLESREYSRRDPSRWPRGTFYPQKSALTSPTNGGRSVGIVRSQTQATEFLPIHKLTTTSCTPEDGTLGDRRCEKLKSTQGSYGGKYWHFDPLDYDTLQSQGWISNVSDEHTASALNCALEKEAGCSSESLAYKYQTTRRTNWEGCNIKLTVYESPYIDRAVKSTRRLEPRTYIYRGWLEVVLGATRFNSLP